MRPLLIRSHQAAIARDIGHEDCRKPAHDPLFRQGPLLRSRPEDVNTGRKTRHARLAQEADARPLGRPMILLDIDMISGFLRYSVGSHILPSPPPRAEGAQRIAHDGACTSLRNFG